MGIGQGLSEPLAAGGPPAGSERGGTGKQIERGEQEGGHRDGERETRARPAHACGGFRDLGARTHCQAPTRSSKEGTPLSSSREHVTVTVPTQADKDPGRWSRASPPGHRPGPRYRHRHGGPETDVRKDAD